MDIPIQDEHAPANYNSVAYHLMRYIHPADAKVIVGKCVAYLKTMEFDSIAFCGLSGALIAPTIAMEMGKTLLAVRKEKSPHSDNDVEGDRAAKRYVIVDDFIGSGATVYNMLEKIRKYAPEAMCLGVLQAYWIDGMGGYCGDYPYVLATEIVKSWEKRNKERLAERCKGTS